MEETARPRKLTQPLRSRYPCFSKPSFRLTQAMPIASALVSIPARCFARYVTTRVASNPMPADNVRVRVMVLFALSMIPWLFVLVRVESGAPWIWSRRFTRHLVLQDSLDVPSVPLARRTPVDLWGRATPFPTGFICGHGGKDTRNSQPAPRAQCATSSRGGFVPQLSPGTAQQASVDAP